MGRIIGPDVPASAAAFLSQRTFVIVSTLASDRIPHASLLGGPAGFVSVPEETRINIAPKHGHSSTVAADLAVNDDLGMLAIDFATRRRIRANGRATWQDGLVSVATREVYSNCPQYIHQRPDLVPRAGGNRSSGDCLTERQQRIVGEADTFFIATSHREAGADVSHRGGSPGFISAGPTSLEWPDFPGNNMFNTLGNLLVNPNCSLLFVDFSSTGATLRIDGTAEVQWEGARAIRVQIAEVIETA